MGRRPHPPREPEPEECCGSGCTRCVWDAYYDKLAEYNQEMASWVSSGSSSEDYDDDSDSEGEEEEANYIGSVVVKFLASDASPSTTAVEADIKNKFTDMKRIIAVKSSQGHGDVANESPICVLNIETVTPLPMPNPGDVAEILIPNGHWPDSDAVDQVCQRLGLSPDACCELHRSPFVPEDNFPPWLPLRKAMTVRELLTYYVDLSSCSYLLRISFFQSLLRLHNNGKPMGADQAALSSVCGTPELLAECASEVQGPHIFRALMNHGNPVCYPSLTDVLDAFPFVKLPLDRLLEISSPLRPRKFSIAGADTDEAGDMRAFQLCLRQIVAPRAANTPPATAPAAAQKLAEILNRVAQRRAADDQLGRLLFRGHASFPLCRQGVTGSVHANLSAGGASSMFVGSSLFGTSVFSQQLTRALASVAQSSAQSPAAKVFLIGAGTGIAPLMAVVETLVRMRRNSNTSDAPFPFHVWYGARTMAELVYHDSLTAAAEQRAIASYMFAVSRDAPPPQPQSSTNTSAPQPKYVTDIMRSNAVALQQSLMDGGGLLFACGPSKVLGSVNEALQSVLGESDDDESMRQHRVLLLEGKNQVMFDVWSSIRDF